MGGAKSIHKAILSNALRQHFSTPIGNLITNEKYRPGVLERALFRLGAVWDSVTGIPPSPPQAAKEAFSLERSSYYAFGDIISSPSIMGRFDSEVGRLDLHQLMRTTPFRGFAKPFRTGNGYIGYGSADVQEGDIVCVLAASTVPVVLRRVGSHYVLVSVCFVLGCMEGEVWPMVTDGRLGLEEFEIH